jgi:hypothetical protein
MKAFQIESVVLFRQSTDVRLPRRWGHVTSLQHPRPLTPLGDKGTGPGQDPYSILVDYNPNSSTVAACHSSHPNAQPRFALRRNASHSPALCFLAQHHFAAPASDPAFSFPSQSKYHPCASENTAIGRPAYASPTLNATW